MRSFVIFFYMFVLKLLKACVEWKKWGNFSWWVERHNFSPGQSCREAIFLESFILRRIFLIIPIKTLLCVCYMNDEDCSLQYQFFHLHWNLTNKETFPINKLYDNHKLQANHVVVKLWAAKSYNLQNAMSWQNLM